MIAVPLDCCGFNVCAVVCTQPVVRAVAESVVFIFFFGGRSSSELEETEIARFAGCMRAFIGAVLGFCGSTSCFAGAGFRRNAGAFHASGS